MKERENKKSKLSGTEEVRINHIYRMDRPTIKLNKQTTKTKEKVLDLMNLSIKEYNNFKTIIQKHSNETNNHQTFLKVTENFKTSRAC